MSHRFAVPAMVVALGAASAAIAAETYQLEKTHVDLLFSIDHLGFTQKHGSFRDLDATLVTPGPKQSLLVEGNLTLHGVTKPLILHATLNKVGANPFDKKPTLGFSATGSLKRSDFGISTYLPMIGDQVTITIDAEFNRKP